MSHSPGPWRVYPVGSCVPHYDVCPRVVSDEPTGRSVSDPIPDADARLIAASPQLLQSLKELLALIDDGVLVRNIERDHEPGWSLKALALVTQLKRAVDVVAAAEGHTP